LLLIGHYNIYNVVYVLSTGTEILMTF